MSATVLQGSVFDVLPTLEPGSVDVCLTSPPYWKLRSYLPAGHPLKPLELGSEATPAEFVANLVRVFDLVKVALADHGVVWCNIGDTYSAYNANRGVSRGKLEGRRNGAHAEAESGLPGGIDAGNLCLIPQRLAIALQDAGWIVRSVVVWAKPAPMPQSVQGWRWTRCRVKVKAGWTKETHPGIVAGNISQSGGVATGKRDGIAQWSDCPGCPKCEPNGGLVLRRGSWRPTSAWEPILLLAKSEKYFCDGESVKTAPAPATVSRDLYSRVLDDPDEQFAVRHDHETLCVSGANARDVQSWAAEPLKEKHYAAFPGALVAWCLRAGTSARGYCPACSAPWVRVLETQEVGDNHGKRDDPHPNGSLTMCPPGAASTSKTLDWRPSCACIGGDTFTPRPALVLDPFCGSGRTGINARRLGLDFTGIELSPEYAELARRLLLDDSPLFNMET